MVGIPLCLAAVADGIWGSPRNRMATRQAVLIQLAIMTVGSALVALEMSIGSTMLGAVMTDFVLAPLGTHYSLALDSWVPPPRRAEVFALLLKP
jgi:hypothetical protein